MNNILAVILSQTQIKVELTALILSKVSAADNGQ